MKLKIDGDALIVEARTRKMTLDVRKVLRARIHDLSVLRGIQSRSRTGMSSSASARGARTGTPTSPGPTATTSFATAASRR